MNTALRRIYQATLRNRCFACLFLAVLLSGGVQPAGAQQSDGEAAFSPDQTEAIQDIVRDYLVRHPEVLFEALRAYETRQRQAAEQRQREAVIANSAELSGDSGSPVLGNPQGDVVIVEFFDYRCPYCRKVAPSVMETVGDDGGIRLVMKEFPILGPESVYAARAALAAGKQGKYEAFHFALMEVQGELSRQAVLSLAREHGLDLERLQRDMLSEDVDSELRRNLKLAETLGINGTPAFVIGDSVIPGALEIDALRTLVARVRANAS